MALRGVRLVETGERQLLPEDARCVSKPADMDFETGSAEIVREGERGPVLRYRAADGTPRTVELAAMPLHERNSGDAILIEVPPKRGRRAARVWRSGEVLP